MKIILKVIYNAILGGIALLAVNFIGGMFGLHIAFNAFSALIAGSLGVPGLALLVILKHVFLV